MLNKRVMVAVVVVIARAFDGRVVMNAVHRTITDRPSFPCHVCSASPSPNSLVHLPATPKSTMGDTLLDTDGVNDAITVMNMSLAELKQYVGRRHKNWADMWIAAAQSQTYSSQKEWLRSIALKIAAERPSAPTQTPSAPTQPFLSIPLAFAQPVRPAQPVPAMPLAYTLPAQPPPAEVQPGAQFAGVPVAAAHSAPPNATHPAAGLQQPCGPPRLRMRT